MTNKIKLYILTAFFVAGLTYAGVIIYNQGQEIKAQKAAFGIFKKESEDQRRSIFKKIDSLRIQDRALGETIQEANRDRKATEAELNKLRTDYEKTNFSNFTNDSLARFFADRRRQR